MAQQNVAMERQGGNMPNINKKIKDKKEEKAEKTKFWRILKKREGKQDILLEKRKKARQEPLDMKSGGVAKRGYGKARR